MPAAALLGGAGLNWTRRRYETRSRDVAGRRCRLGPRASTRASAGGWTRTSRLLATTSGWSSSRRRTPACSIRVREGGHHRRARLRAAPDPGRARHRRGARCPGQPGYRGQRGVPPRRRACPGPDPQGRSYQTYASFPAIQMATDGCSRRSVARGCPAGSGRTDDGHRGAGLACCMRRPSITIITRRPMPLTTGGTGMPPTWSPVKATARPTRRSRPLLPIYGGRAAHPAAMSWPRPGWAAGSG